MRTCYLTYASLFWWILGHLGGFKPLFAKDDFTPLDEASLRCMRDSYPQEICGYNTDTLIWCDGTTQKVTLNKPLLKEWDFTHAEATYGHSPYEARLAVADMRDQLTARYFYDHRGSFAGTFDAGRMRNQYFFQKVYGDSPQQVAGHLSTLPWPWQGGPQTIQLSTKAGIKEKWLQLSEKLAQRAKEFTPFLLPVGGSFVFRPIAGTTQLSTHSYGIALDLALERSDYWRWNHDLMRTSLKARAKPRQTPPKALINLFEEADFIWGGNWVHFDTMHFEYRPELFCLSRFVDTAKVH